jgi:hypothetical protein
MYRCIDVCRHTLSDSKTNNVHSIWRGDKQELLDGAPQTSLNFSYIYERRYIIYIRSSSRCVGVCVGLSICVDGIR